VVVLILALGIGASTAMFSVMEAALGRELPFPDSERLIVARNTFGGQVGTWSSFPDYLDYRDQADSFESLATILYGPSPATVTGAGEPEEARVIRVTGNLFGTLGVHPLMGRTFTIPYQGEGGESQVVLSFGFWQRALGGARDVVGRTLMVNGETHTITGVMPAGFRFLFDVDLWMPPRSGRSNPRNRDHFIWLTVGRLAPGVALEAAQSEVDAISGNLQEAYPDTNRDRALRLDGLHTVMVEGARHTLMLFTGAVVLLLLIACGNVVSLLMARGVTRKPELAVRVALGAGPLRLTRQLLVECILLAVVGGGLGVFLAMWLQNGILGFIPLDALGLREVGFSVRMLGIGLGVSLISILLFGILPSLASARANPGQDLREGSRKTTSRSGFHVRNGLVVLQVALSLVLLTGAGLLVRSVSKLWGVERGFRVENLLTASISLSGDRYSEEDRQIEFFRSLRESIEALPGVDAVALADRLPILSPWGNNPVWALEGPRPDQPPLAELRVVLPGYFTGMNVPLLAGRALEESDGPGSPPVAVLTRAAADRLYLDRSAIGKLVAVGYAHSRTDTVQVVGVVEDHRMNALARTPRPAVFLTHAQFPSASMSLAVGTTVEPETLLRPIQERLWALDPNLVLSSPQSMEDAIANSIAGSRSMTILLTLFAVVALSLAAMGLYGGMAFFVNQRVREIGIRVALGASGGRVLGLVVHRGMLLVGLGSVTGIVGSLYTTRLVEGMLFEVTPTDPVALASVTGFLLLVALGACLIPSWRALQVDPVEAIRVE
jgi:putative ABC transport system permease protein